MQDIMQIENRNSWEADYNDFICFGDIWKEERFSKGGKKNIHSCTPMQHKQWVPEKPKSTVNTKQQSQPEEQLASGALLPRD